MSERIRRIKDAEVRELAMYAQMLREEYVQPGVDPWEASPFGWIKKGPSRQVGAIGERLVSAWCAAKGLDVVKSPDSEADRIIEGRRVEIKFSTLWQSGVYKFQQIRDQNYDLVFALGISPLDAHAWVISKAVLNRYVIGHMGQHTGAEARDTSWLSVRVGQEPDWLRACGGTLAAAHGVLAAADEG